MIILRSSVLILLLLIAGCGKHRTGSSTRPDEESRFRITDSSDFRIITINDPWQGSGRVTFRYYLVKRGHIPPRGVDSMSVIFVPLRKIICMSTTYLAMIQALGEENTIIGVSGTGFIYSEVLRKKAESGMIREVGYESNLDNELIAKLKPDLVMMYGVAGESASYASKLKELGIRVLFNADYLERNPLRRCEWIKLFGALYCKDEAADSIFRNESLEYLGLRQVIASQVSSYPRVMLGLPYKDTWFISPGNSYISTLIEDAGGSYIWKNIKSDSALPMGIENVYTHALNADFWLNPGTAGKKAEITAIDSRLSELPCFKMDKIFNNNRRLSPGGGNDFWETGVLHPSLILKDIAQIIHPGILDGHELFFYRQLN